MSNPPMSGVPAPGGCLWYRSTWMTDEESLAQMLTLSRL